MKKDVNPIAIIAGIVVLLAFVVFMYSRTMSAKAPDYTISAPGNDLDGAAAKRANRAKAQGLPAPTGKPAAGQQGD